MRNFNFLYWIVFPLILWVFYTLRSGTISNPESFLGFADSRQVELNLPLDAMIDTVYVQSGDVVKAGTPLLRVTSKTSELDARKAVLQKASLDVKRQWTRQELIAKREAVIGERDQKIAELQARKAIKSEETTFYQSILSESGIRDNEEVKALEEEIEKVGESYARQLRQIEKLLSMEQEEESVKALVQAELESLEKTRDGFLIKAPFDGVVGNISLHPGEYKEAFTSLATLFAAAPTVVTGYIDEKYEVDIQNGDSVQVLSAYLVKKGVQGIVTRKGNRIVEIPEKFSQAPGVKRYGIEVFIEIPIQNEFLQKEVLKIGVF